MCWCIECWFCGWYWWWFGYFLGFCRMMDVGWWLLLCCFEGFFLRLLNWWFYWFGEEWYLGLFLDLVYLYRNELYFGILGGCWYIIGYGNVLWYGGLLGLFWWWWLSCCISWCWWFLFLRFCKLWFEIWKLFGVFFGWFLVGRVCRLWKICFVEVVGWWWLECGDDGYWSLGNLVFWWCFGFV